MVLLFFFFLTKECWFSNNFSGALDFIFHCNQTCCHFYSCPIFLFFLVFLACSSRAASIALKNVNNLSVMNYFVFGYVLSVRVSFKVIFLEERSRELFFVGINEGKFFSQRTDEGVFFQNTLGCVPLHTFVGPLVSITMYFRMLFLLGFNLTFLFHQSQF